MSPVTIGRVLTVQMSKNTGGVSPIDPTKIAALEKAESVPSVDTSAVPDLIEPITGYRVWLSGDQEAFGPSVGNSASPAFQLRPDRLCSFQTTEFWQPRKPIRANCKLKGSYMLTGVEAVPVPQEVPAKTCSCGVWAVRSMADLQAVLAIYYHDFDPADAIVLGSVHLWGRVIEHELGYRAEFAYPKEIWALRPEQEELGRIYGVPVRRV